MKRAFSCNILFDICFIILRSDGNKKYFKINHSSLGVPAAHAVSRLTDLLPMMLGFYFYMEKFDFTKLNSEEQQEYKKVAEQMFGKTIVFVETGEPLYFDEKCLINPIHQFILDRMKLNKNLN